MDSSSRGNAGSGGFDRNDKIPAFAGMTCLCCLFFTSIRQFESVANRICASFYAKNFARGINSEIFLQNKNAGFLRFFENFLRRTKK